MKKLAIAMMLGIAAMSASAQVNYKGCKFGFLLIEYPKNAGGKTMSIEKVRAYFRPLGLEERIRELEASSATVELAALALGVDGARIAKTLSFLVGDRCILIVTAGDARIDNHKYKARFGVKAKMPAHDEVPECTGHAVGGVCPFACKEGVSVYLDESLKRFRTVFPACGSANSAIELTIPELEQYSGCDEWVDVCKGWQAASE